MLRHGSRALLSSRFALASTAAAALFSGILALGTGLALQSFERAQSVRVSPTQLTWWQGARLEFAGTGPQGLQIADEITIHAGAHAERAQQDLDRKQNEAVRRQAQVQENLRREALRRRVAERRARRLAAAARQARSAVAQNPSIALPEERAAVRAFHDLLRSRFLIAMNIQPDTQYAVQAPDSTEATVAAWQEESQSEPALKITQAATQDSGPEDSGSQSVVAETERSQEQPQLTEPTTRISNWTTLAAKPVESVNTQLTLDSQNAIPSETKTLDLPPSPRTLQMPRAEAEPIQETPTRVLAESESATPTSRDIVSEIVETPTVTHEVAPTEGDSIVASSANTLPVTTQAVAAETIREVPEQMTTQRVVTQSPSVAPARAITLPTQATLRQKSDARKSNSASESPPEKPAPPKVAETATASGVGSGVGIASLQEPSKVIADQVTHSSARTTASSAVNLSGVEAFDWKTPVPAAKITELTDESRLAASSARTGWNRASSPDHWTTYAWSADAQPIPMVSRNSAKLLSVMSGATLQENAGIIFGKVPSGWTVEVSARAEKPIFLNDKNVSLNASDASTSRYFAFVNAAPGAHLLYLVDPSGRERAAIAVPVSPMTATYADLTRPARVTVRGRVLAANANRAAGILRATVRVVGQSTRLATTDRFGEFRIDDVVSFGTHPIWVETLEASGYTHRYRISADGRARDLYRFDRERVHGWIDQLEGGLNAESSMVVGAVPEMLGRASNGLQASLEPLLANSPLTPETYTINEEDLLQVGAPMSAQVPRFLSVQVPDGANLVVFEDPVSRRAHTELIFASPGVISVVGPY